MSYITGIFEALKSPRALPAALETLLVVMNLAK